MRSALAFALAAAPFVLAQDDDGTSSKRGLVYVVPEEDLSDNHFWDSAGSDLTWYYNYQTEPTNGIDLEFVPMLWGAQGSENFYDSIKSLVNRNDNIKYVLAFNEPDGTSATGGSEVDPVTAASIWMDQIEPLKKLGLTLGAPAVTGSQRGLDWMQAFFTECDGKCSAAFFPAHWYGDFQGMASYLGQVNGTYPNMTLWVTEYAYPDGSLEDSQEFLNQSMEYFDRLEFCERYSYFGSFRSDISNVGKNAAMLTQKGELTDIGAYYLGEPELAVGNKPKGDATQTTKFAGWAGLVVFAMACALL